MSKVFNAYAQRKGLDPKALRFLLDGQRIADDETPKTLELEDEDQIDCLLEQLGGKCQVVGLLRNINRYQYNIQVSPMIAYTCIYNCDCNTNFHENHNIFYSSYNASFVKHLK